MTSSMGEPMVYFYLAGGKDPIREIEAATLNTIPRSGERVFLADPGGWRTVRHVQHDILLNDVEIYLNPSDVDKNRNKNGDA